MPLASPKVNMCLWHHQKLELRAIYIKNEWESTEKNLFGERWISHCFMLWKAGKGIYLQIQISRFNRSSHQRCSVRKGVLRNFTIFTGKHLCLRPAALIKKETLAQVFSCEFCKISKNTFFTEHLWATASYLFNCRLAEEGGILTDCSIKTQEPEDIVDFNFSSADVVNKIIMKVRGQLCFLFRQLNHGSICSAKTTS